MPQVGPEKVLSQNTKQMATKSKQQTKQKKQIGFEKVDVRQNKDGFVKRKGTEENKN